MSSRELADWIEAYLAYAEDTEPPKSFHIWTAASCIAGALQRKVYMKWGYDTIYPNMYVILVGPSGRARKGTAMNIGKDLMTGTGVSMTAESITREALIRDMKDAASSFTNATNGRVYFHCSLTVMSGELSVFLGQNDVKFLADLTDWYDSMDTWTYRTKGAGTDKIQGVCFNLLGATAPDWLQSILPQEAIGGGFTSRIIFIVEEDKGKTVAKPVVTEEMADLRSALKRDLERIATLSGEMKFSSDAEEFYINWYEQHEKAIAAGKPSIDDPRFSGYLDRRATHLRKLSIILSACRLNKLTIELQDIERADKVLRQAEINMPKVFGGLGESLYSRITEKVLTYIKSRRKVSRSELMRKFYRDMDPQTLDIVESTMTQMKMVRVVRSTTTGDTIYEYIA